MVIRSRSYHGTRTRVGWRKKWSVSSATSAEFDVILTMDRGIEYQQNLAGLDLYPIVLSAVSNDIDDLLPLVPAINAALSAKPTEALPGRVIHIK